MIKSPCRRILKKRLFEGRIDTKEYRKKLLMLMKMKSMHSSKTRLLSPLSLVFANQSAGEWEKKNGMRSSNGSIAGGRDPLEVQIHTTLRANFELKVKYWPQKMADFVPSHSSSVKSCDMADRNFCSGYPSNHPSYAYVAAVNERP